MTEKLRKTAGREKVLMYQAGTATVATKAIVCSISTRRLCGQPVQQDSAQLPSASVMICLMVRAHRPHSALQPRHP